jgi:hypothetical protein
VVADSLKIVVKAKRDLQQLLLQCLNQSDESKVERSKSRVLFSPVTIPYLGFGVE